MSNSRTLHLTASSAFIAASLALTIATSQATAADGTHLGTDHLAQAIGQSAGLDASAVWQITGAEFDIGVVAALPHEQFAQYLVDHALELSQNR